MHNDTRKTLEELQDWIDVARDCRNNEGEYAAGVVDALNMVWREISRKIKDDK